MMKIKKIISLLSAFILFALLIKYFYFDTNLGYNLEIPFFSFTGCPLFIEVFLLTLFLPFILYIIMEEILNKVNSLIKKMK